MPLTYCGNSKAYTATMTPEEIKKQARQYPQIIRWSEEDTCYIGSLPDICGDCCDATTPQEVATRLAEIAEDWVATLTAQNIPLPAPRATMVRPSHYRSGNIGNRIKGLREHRGLSQQGLADLLGISLSTLTKWENNLRRPSGAAAKLLDILENHPELVA